LGVRVGLATLAFVALAAGCGGHHGAPNVKGKRFPAALARLRAGGWLVSVPSFPRVYGSLESYRVVAQRTSGRRTVTLKLAEAPSSVVLVVLSTDPPPPVPRLVGRTYRNADRAVQRSALWLRVARVKPLRPAASADGIDAFFVVSERVGANHSVVVTLGERPCWKTVINDWFVDTRLNGVYARRCYREALREIPGDLARNDLARLLQRRLR
jgi:hypothetical protein